MRRDRRFFGLSVLMACCLLVACGGKASPDPAPASETVSAGNTGEASAIMEEAQPEVLTDLLRIGMMEADELSPFLSETEEERFIQGLLQAQLFRMHGGEPEPELCKDFAVSEDGKTYTYVIRDAYYHDGTKIKADDFAYMIERGGIPGERSGNEAVCTVIDPVTFQITFPEEDPERDGRFEIWPVNRTFAEERGDAYARTPADLLYSGPYRMVARISGKSMLLQKNPEYCNAAEWFPMQEIRLSLGNGAAELYRAAEDGEVDLIVGMQEQVADMFGKGGTDLPEPSAYETGKAWILLLNGSSYAYSAEEGFVLRDEAITEWMSDAGNRERILAAVGQEEGTGDSDAEGKTVPELTFLIPETEHYQEMAAAVLEKLPADLQAQIKLVACPAEEAALRQIFHQFDLTILETEYDAEKPFAWYSAFTTEGSVSDAAGFAAAGIDPMFVSLHAVEAYDALLAEAGKTQNKKERQRLFDEAEQLLRDDAICLILEEESRYDWQSQAVDGYAADVTHDLSGITLIPQP